MSNSLAGDVIGCLRRRPGLNVVAAVGNAMRGDDGVGPYIVSRLLPGESFAVFDAGMNPENIVDQIIELNPSYVLFIDAADFRGEPGQARAIGKEELSGYTMSTHMVPLRVIWELIERGTGAEVRCVGVQASDCGFHDGLSGETLDTANTIIDELLWIVNESK